MKTTPAHLAAYSLLLWPAVVAAQAVPTTPTKFSVKPVGNSTNTTGASINPPPAQPAVRKVTTYLTLSPLRQWNSTDGKSLMGKLIAWEETVTTSAAVEAAAAPTAPITTKPTVLKNNKARFLIDNKAYEVPLDRLAPAEQKFITDLQVAIAAKP